MLDIVNEWLNSYNHDIAYSRSQGNFGRRDQFYIALIHYLYYISKVSRFGTVREEEKMNVLFQFLTKNTYRVCLLCSL